MDKYWSALNWLTSHRLKYITLILYICVSIVSLPFVWVLILLAYVLESELLQGMGKVVTRIYKGERI
jgi:hypothetical protein